MMKRKRLEKNSRQKAICVALSVAFMAGIAGCGTQNDVDETLIPEEQTVEYEIGGTEGTTEINMPDETNELLQGTSENAVETTDLSQGTSDLSEQSQDLTFADLSKLQFEFASGAGGWSEGFTIEKDGSLQGNYHDSDMGDIGEGYPNGTFYCSSYTGQFTELHKINEYTYEMKLANISYKDPVGTDEICDEMHYIYTDSYCLGGNDTFQIYLPGTPISELSEDVYSWIFLANENETELTMTIIVDEENGYGIYSYERLTPLEDAQSTLKMYKDSYDYYENECAKAETTLEMVTCAEAMYKASDDCLNYIWKLVKYNVDEEKFNEILTKQREWIAEKENRAKEITSGDGSMAAVDCNLVMAELTMERCEELIVYLEQ